MCEREIGKEEGGRLGGLNNKERGRGEGREGRGGGVEVVKVDVLFVCVLESFERVKCMCCFYRSFFYF